MHADGRDFLMVQVLVLLKHLKQNLQVSAARALMHTVEVDKCEKIFLKASAKNRDIFCVGRVAEDDLNTATCGTVQTSVNYVIYEVLGSCEIFEEKQVGNERFNIFSGCHSTTTIVLRGGADQFIEEAERSLHDAIMIVRRALELPTVFCCGLVQ
ncbi:T-complex protein 1 subunit eta-like protein [Tanacetum coccineum]|uniref:T-complex protein 1 subunit eta-like protein n=1 Tax=Tanacetum coccineum TaxID=301880 RepID=A0ABQ5CMP9_9ASTR